jgi:hypothetical protein
MKHWRRILILVGALLVYFLIFGAIFGYHRLKGEFIPFDASTVGASIYASFIWLPIAFVGGWIASDLRNEKNLIRQKELFEAHAATIDKKLDEHHLRMAKLLGVDEAASADILSATPADRSLEEPSS